MHFEQCFRISFSSEKKVKKRLCFCFGLIYCLTVSILYIKSWTVHRLHSFLVLFVCFLTEKTKNNTKYCCGASFPLSIFSLFGFLSLSTGSQSWWWFCARKSWPALSMDCYHRLVWGFNSIAWSRSFRSLSLPPSPSLSLSLGLEQPRFCLLKLQIHHCIRRL